ncbi:MAG: 23S rRNA (guanosine(2251)-2'-O)-methyltransferase RlmB [Clostridia bacterium]
MFSEIISRSNKTFKHIKSLGSKSCREKNNEFIIEGVRLIKDAIDSSVDFKMIVINDSFLEEKQSKHILERLLDHNISVFKFSNQMFQEVSHTETPQGILGVVSIKTFYIDHITGSTNCPFYIFCDNVQDPGNMGTIIRTADAAGADAVILSKGCVDVYNPKTVRSTMGSLFHLPVIKVENTAQVLSSLKHKGISIISGHLSSDICHFEVNMKKGIMIVVGNEANGISEEVINLSDYFVKIPISGKAESLNVAIASAILMYEAVRQRN